MNTKHYLLRMLLDKNYVDVGITAENEEKALSLSLAFINYDEDMSFELYDVNSEEARRIC